MSRRHRLASLCLTVPALAAGGCGGDDTDAAPAAGTASSRTGQGRVRVRLSEYRISADPAAAPAGRVTFAVTNDGAIPHEFVVVRTPKPAGALLDGARADERGRAGVLDEHALTVGAKKALTLHLQAGHYALLCNLPGHYEGGMHLDFTVR